MHSYGSSEILVTVLRSTSFLLEHYGYSGHDPSLSELQRSLGRAMAQLEAQAPADCAAGIAQFEVQGDSAAPNAFESQ
jgi:hypothetical protein